MGSYLHSVAGRASHVAYGGKELRHEGRGPGERFFRERPAV